MKLGPRPDQLDELDDDSATSAKRTPSARVHVKVGAKIVLL